MLGGKIRSSKEKKREKGGEKVVIHVLVRSGCPMVLYSWGIVVMLGEY